MNSVNKASAQLEHQKQWFNSHYQTFSEYKLENWRISILNRVFGNLEISGESRQGYYLDIGVGGSGYTVIEAARLGQAAVGVDLSFVGVSQAKKFADGRKDLKAKCFFVVCSAEALPFKSNTFLKISALSVLEHLYGDRECVAEISRIAQNAARIYITVPNSYRRMWFFLALPYYIIDKNIGHLRHYLAEELIRLFGDRGFVHVQTIYNGHLIKLVQLILEKIFGEARLGKLWWQLENIDMHQKDAKNGLQLSIIFHKQLIG